MAVSKISERAFGLTMADEEVMGLGFSNNQAQRQILLFLDTSQFQLLPVGAKLIEVYSRHAGLIGELQCLLEKLVAKQVGSDVTFKSHLEGTAQAVSFSYPIGKKGRSSVMVVRLSVFRNFSIQYADGHSDIFETIDEVADELASLYHNGQKKK